jgi:TRAP-type C4-dicarboxylate transport system permease small subunit
MPQQTVIIARGWTYMISMISMISGIFRIVRAEFRFGTRADVKTIES